MDAKTTLVLLVLAATTAVSVLADNHDADRYVIDTVVITVRAAPDDNSEILSRLSTGDKVLVTGASSENYQQVSLSDGVIGWVEGQYLTRTPMARTELRALQAEYLELERRFEEARIAQTETEQSLIRLTDDYRLANEELEQLRGSAGDPSATEEELQHSKERLALYEAETEQLLRLNKEIKESADTRWFLIGAGVLLAGIVLGFAIPRGRRRSSSWDRL
ncbi:MAG: hypothetical protein CMO26_14740 [Thiotrichales bacterium]|nr:hypothetical protein [Thiotrichales bacterium]